MKRVEISLEDHVYRRLQHLAAAVKERDEVALTVSALTAKILDHLDEAISRSGGWERRCFYFIFADSLEVAQARMHALGDQPRLRFVPDLGRNHEGADQCARSNRK